MFEFGLVFNEFKARGFNVKVFSSYKISDSVDKWTDITWILDMEKLDLRDKMMGWERALSKSDISVYWNGCHTKDVVELVKPEEIRDMNDGTVTLREGLIVKDDADYSLLDQMLLKAEEDKKRNMIPDYKWFVEHQFHPDT